MLRVTDHISIPEEELERRFTRSSGPGGQNVNKVASRVELRFDLNRTESLPADVVARIKRREKGRVTKEGVLRIVCQVHREQGRNLAEARERLADVIRAALVRPKKRTKTKPTRASRQKRLDAKRRRSQIKNTRGRVRGDD